MSLQCGSYLGLPRLRLAPTSTVFLAWGVGAAGGGLGVLLSLLFFSTCYHYIIFYFWLIEKGLALLIIPI